MRHGKEKAVVNIDARVLLPDTAFYSKGSLCQRITISHL
jgi:hypothetical protein